jgi:hypothetical protein
VKSKPKPLTLYSPHRRPAGLQRSIGWLSDAGKLSHPAPHEQKVAQVSPSQSYIFTYTMTNKENLQRLLQRNTQLFGENDPSTLDLTNQGNQWEILPAEIKTLGRSAIAPERALAILKAFVEGATKREIVRVFDIRESAVRAVIETARKAAVDYSYAG